MSKQYFYKAANIAKLQNSRPPRFSLGVSVAKPTAPPPLMRSIPVKDSSYIRHLLLR